MSSSEPCPFCAGISEPFATAVVLGGHRASYLRCRACASVHVASPSWLAEAYASAIASTDVGLASRSVWCSNLTSLVIRRFFPDARRFCDVGAGTGLFVRLMRDAGFDFVWEDPNAANEFAVGHEASPGEVFDLLTAFEVIEHLEDPGALVRRAARAGAALLLTTELVPDDTPSPQSWPYYSLDTGQHITFASARGLRALAEAHGLQVTSAGSVHLLATREYSSRQLRLLTAQPVARRLGPWATRRSLLSHDADAALRALRDAQVRASMRG
jgi:hypothetical protein